MHKSADKESTRRFAEEAMKRKPDSVHIDQIVYLDEDLHTYKYFMTGEFDEDARKRAIQAQQAEAQRLANDRSGSSDNSSVERADEDNQGDKSAFFNKLQQLNDKISVFKSQFYAKQPRDFFNYDKILKDKRLNFKTFKSIYGHNDGRKGQKTVKIGSETLVVDSQNYTYQVAPPPENEARKRLLGQTQSSQQRTQSSDLMLAQQSTLKSMNKKSSLILPVMEVGSTTLQRTNASEEQIRKQTQGLTRNHSNKMESRKVELKNRLTMAAKRPSELSRDSVGGQRRGMTDRAVGQMHPLDKDSNNQGSKGDLAMTSPGLQRKFVERSFDRLPKGKTVSVQPQPAINPNWRAQKRVTNFKNLDKTARDYISHQDQISNVLSKEDLHRTFGQRDRGSNDSVALRNKIDREVQSKSVLSNFYKTTSLVPAINSNGQQTTTQLSTKRGMNRKQSRKQIRANKLENGWQNTMSTNLGSFQDQYREYLKKGINQHSMRKLKTLRQIDRNIISKSQLSQKNLHKQNSSLEMRKSQDVIRAPRTRLDPIENRQTMGITTHQSGGMQQFPAMDSTRELLANPELKLEKRVLQSEYLDQGIDTQQDEDNKQGQTMSREDDEGQVRTADMPYEQQKMSSRQSPLPESARIQMDPSKINIVSYGESPENSAKKKVKLRRRKGKSTNHASFKQINAVNNLGSIVHGPGTGYQSQFDSAKTIPRNNLKVTLSLSKNGLKLNQKNLSPKTISLIQNQLERAKTKLALGTTSSTSKVLSLKNSTRASRQGSVSRALEYSLPAIGRLNSKGSSKSPQKGFNFGSDPYSQSASGMHGLTATTKIENTDAQIKRAQKAHGLFHQKRLTNPQSAISVPHQINFAPIATRYSIGSSYRDGLNLNTKKQIPQVRDKNRTQIVDKLITATQDGDLIKTVE